MNYITRSRAAPTVPTLNKDQEISTLIGQTSHFEGTTLNQAMFVDTKDTITNPLLLNSVSSGNSQGTCSITPNPNNIFSTQSIANLSGSLSLTDSDTKKVQEDSRLSNLLGRDSRQTSSASQDAQESVDEMLTRIRGKMSYEQLIEFMADITLKRRSDPQAVQTILKKLYESEIDIKTVEHAKSERLLRELLSSPLDMFMASNKLEFEKMKKLAKLTLKKWADLRRQHLLELEQSKSRATINKKTFQTTLDSSESQVEGNPGNSDQIMNLQPSDRSSKSFFDKERDSDEKHRSSLSQEMDSKTDSRKNVSEGADGKKTGKKLESKLLSLKEVKSTARNILDHTKPRDIRASINSMIEYTGMTYRDQLRRKLVNIMRDSMKQIVYPGNSKAQLTDGEKNWATECGLRIEDQLNVSYSQVKTYSDKARSLLFNLSDSKNFELRFKILNQELSAQQLVHTDVKKLASEWMKQKREESLLRTLSMKRTDWDVQETLSQGEFQGMFQCECGSQKTGYIQLQIERADEPMTNFVYCYDCENRWKC
eukprot:403349966